MRLAPGHELELRWYALEAGAALGERSPLGVQLELMRQGVLDCSHNSCGPDMDRAASVIKRFDAIRDRLRRMPRRKQRVLLLAYCGDVDGLRHYDRLGPICGLTRAGRAAYARAMAKLVGAEIASAGRISVAEVGRWLSRRLRTDTELRAAVLAEADEMLSAACEAWEEAR